MQGFSRKTPPITEAHTFSASFRKEGQKGKIPLRAVGSERNSFLVRGNQAELGAHGRVAFIPIPLPATPCSWDLRMVYNTALPCATKQEENPQYMPAFLLVPRR